MAASLVLSKEAPKLLRDQEGVKIPTHPQTGVVFHLTSIDVGEMDVPWVRLPPEYVMAK